MHIMKTTSKYNFKRLTTKSSALLALILLMPISTLAIESENSGESSGSGSSSSFCSKFSVESAKITTKMTEKATKLTTAWNKQNEVFTSKSIANDQKVNEARVKSDAARTKNILALESKASNEAQTQAVKSYEAAVKSAISARRASYDAAKATFRSAVQSAVETKQGSVIKQYESFTAAVNTAIGTAQASCTATPTNSSAIRDTFKASMKSAKSTYLKSRSSDGTIGSQVKQLVVTRNSAFKAADTAFQAAMSTAKDSLKVAFTKAT